MANIKDRNGLKEIRYLDRNRERRSLYAGKITKRNAEEIGRLVEAIVARQIQGFDPDAEQSLWLSRLEDSFHAKLSKLGLCSPRRIEDPKPTLKAWTDRYVVKHTGKPSTIEQLTIAAKDLCDFLGDEKPID
jgi:hypothetical protein